MSDLEYRERIYKAYVSGRQKSPAPEAVAGLGGRAASLRRIIRNHFPPDRNASILDLGCGHGAFIWFIRQAGFENVTGVDGAAEQVEAARRLGIEGVVQGDLMEAVRGEPDASRDVVISYDVIEHLRKGELLDLTDEVFRILKPSGRWIIHAPNGESPFVGRIRYGDFTHEQAFTRESITQLLKTSGFTSVICEEDAPVPHGAKSAVRWVLWKLIRGMLGFYMAVETGAVDREAIFTQNFLTIAVK